jgi:hypothetical protein
MEPKYIHSFHEGTDDAQIEKNMNQIPRVSDM